jgi:Na+/proline symporter
MVYIILIAFLVAPIFVAQMIGKPKNRQGWVWGLFLGWLGVIIVACLGPNTPALTAKQREVAELEAEVRLVELRQRQAALTSGE